MASDGSDGCGGGTGTDDEFDRDLAVVGGGPTGTGVGVFAGRYGFDVIVFDRGAAALPRCAFLTNYPGFPAGIDVGTFRGLLADHLDEAGCDVVADTVERVEPRDDGGFDVETADGREVAARYVVAASWYDGSYLRPALGDDAFDVHERDGETRATFDGDYPDEGGRTPVDGLYVAAPAGGRNAQAVIAAGNGASVARALIADHRRARGYPDGVAHYFDWLRTEAEFAGEWGERDRWREFFDAQTPEDHHPAEDLDDLREEYVEERFDSRCTAEEAEARRERAHDRLLEHLDDDRIRAYAARLDDAAPGANEGREDGDRE